MEADLQYLEYARKLTLYGVDLHEARVISLFYYSTVSITLLRQVILLQILQLLQVYLQRPRIVSRAHGTVYSMYSRCPILSARGWHTVSVLENARRFPLFSCCLQRFHHVSLFPQRILYTCIYVPCYFFPLFFYSLIKICLSQSVSITYFIWLVLRTLVKLNP